MNGNATRAANNNNKHAVESGMNAGGTAGSNANTSTNVVALDLTNTDDFVGGLSQACINPLFTSSDSQKKEAEPKQTNGSNGNVIIVPRSRRSRRRRQRQAAKVVEEEVLTAAAAEKEPATTTTADDTATTKTAAVASSASTTKTSDKDDENDIVKATIADCLACSGCVTTAETVLLEQNNNSELFLQQIAVGLDDVIGIGVDVPNSKKKKTIVVLLTISPSSLADLQRHLFGCGGSSTAVSSTSNGNGNSSSSSSKSQQQNTLSLIRYWFAYLNIQYVIDGNLPLLESRQQAAIEFVTAYRKHSRQKQKEELMTTTEMMEVDHKKQMPLNEEEQVDEEEELYECQLVPSVALSSSQTQYYFTDSGKFKTITHGSQNASGSFRKDQSLPLLSSSCPAMVCYVETSMHQHVPHLSKVVSSMTYSSSTTKTTKSTAGTSKNLRNNKTTTTVDDDTSSSSTTQFFHLAVMPCHDKKLESSRRDFLSTPDMVLTTTEFLDVMEQVCPMSLNEYFYQQQQSQQSHSNDAVRIVRPKNGLDEVSDIIMQQDRDKVEQMIVDDDEDKMMMMNGNGSNTISSTVVLRPTWFTIDEDSNDDYSDSNDNNNDDKSSSPFVHGSGGYADYIFRYALRHLFGINNLEPYWIRGNVSSSQHRAVSSARRRKQQQESTNYYETRLLQSTTTGQYFVPTSSDDCHKDDSEKDVVKTLLRFGIAYGLQTVQTVLKNTGSSTTSKGEREEKAPFDYLEVMACPSSCLNGNGQIKKVQQQQQQKDSSSSSLQLETPRESRQRISETQRYFTTVNSFESNKEDRRDDDFTDKPPITTRYHVVPPMQHTMGAAAGVAVQDTQW